MSNLFLKKGKKKQHLLPFVFNHINDILSKKLMAYWRFVVDGCMYIVLLLPPPPPHPPALFLFSVAPIIYHD